MTMTITGDVTVGAELESLPKNIAIHMWYYQDGTITIDGNAYDGNGRTTIYCYKGQQLHLKCTDGRFAFWRFYNDNLDEVAKNYNADTYVTVDGSFTYIGAAYN